MNEKQIIITKGEYNGIGVDLNDKTPEEITKEP